MVGVKEIYIEAENWLQDQSNYEDDNTNVIVTMNNNRKYIATFFTYKNINSLKQKNNKTGECLRGKYFWASNMILIDNCSRNNIESVIKHLITENEFYQTFNEITN